MKIAGAPPNPLLTFFSEMLKFLGGLVGTGGLHVTLRGAGIFQPIHVTLRGFAITLQGYLGAEGLRYL